MSGEEPRPIADLAHVADRLAALEVPRYFTAHPANLAALLKIDRPSVHALFTAGWRAGFTVNGMRPP